MFAKQPWSVWGILFFAIAAPTLDGVVAQDGEATDDRKITVRIRDLEGEVRDLRSEVEQLRDLAEHPNFDNEEVRTDLSNRTMDLRRKERELATLRDEAKQLAQQPQKANGPKPGLQPNPPKVPGRDATGYPEWPLFDVNAAADTLRAVNEDIRPENPGRMRSARGRRPAVDEPKFVYAPAWTHGEFANLPDGAFTHAVVGPNKKIYFIPFNAATVLVYEPVTRRTATIALPNGHITEKYVGGVLGPDGRIYCAPFHHATDMAIIDTNNDTARLEPVRAGPYKWRGGVLAPRNGKIYFPPEQAGVSLTIDTANGHQVGELVGNPPFPPSAFSGAAIGGDGRVYFVPLDSRTCFSFDPQAPDKVDTFGNAPGGFAYNGAVTGPDGSVYCVPFNADHVLVIDPKSRSARPLQLPGQKPIVGRDKYAGGVLGPDGNIYCIPFAESRILVIDTPKSGEFGGQASLRYWGDGRNEYKQDRYVHGAYHGGVLGPDGKIYLVPWNAKHLCAIGRRQDMNMNRVLSPMFNKY